MSEITVGVYVPSYHRSNAIITDKILLDCTYVVRKSEEQLYKDAGVRKVLAVEDSEIDSMSKVRQWILDNSPEDIIVQVDDDIKDILYRMDFTRSVEDKETIQMEFERIAQIMSDLEIGYGGVTVTSKPWSYDREFQFAGLVGGIYWYNKKVYKAKNDMQADCKEDVDKVLQELLVNRIIIIPKYLAMNTSVDKNAGGDNDSKNNQKIIDCNLYMKQKWGKYYDFDYKKNTPSIRVKR